MWRLGFLFHEMAFGLLSVFLPLYIISIGGSLLDIGVMTFIASLMSIPAFFFWGYMCDKTHHYKRYILVSFLSTSLLLYLFTLSTNVSVLIILYVIMAVFHAAHEPPKNVLIAEYYPREEWERAYAIYEALTEIGWITGLCIGIFIASSAGLNAKITLLICSGSNFLAFFLSMFLIADPIIIFERGLVNIEKSVDLTHKGVTLASKILEGFSVRMRLKMENVYAFCGGLALFSLATNILFTPLPVFFSKDLNLPASMIYAIYVSNSTASAIGYSFAGSELEQHKERMRLQKIVLVRSLLAFLLAGFAALRFGTAIAATLILTLMGFAYALYHVSVLSLSMELIPSGKAGLFDVLVSIGSAIGAFTGPLIAQLLGFTYVFLFSGIAFLLAYALFKAYY
ncbi:MAG: MFS transporter [Candidatus Bathyarchaeia archaeon]